MPSAGSDEREVHGRGTRAFAWSTLLDTYIPSLVFALGMGIVLPAIPTVARSFDVSFGLASAVLTAYVLGNMVGTVPTGWVIDRFGRRRVMLVGPFVSAMLSFLVIVARTFPQFLLLRFFDGWCAQMWLIGRMSGIAARAGADQRGRHVAWMFGFDTTGRLIGPVAGGFIAAAWGLRAPFAAYGLMSLLTLIPVGAFIRDVPASETEGVEARNAPRLRGSISKILLPRLGFFGIALAGALARGPISNGLFLLYATFVYDMGAKPLGLLAAGSGILSLPIGFLAGWMMDRLGRRRWLIPGYLATGAAIALIAVTAALHLPAAWFVATYLGVFAAQALTSGSIQTIGADVAPPEARGFFLGVWNLANQGGSATGPVAFAFLAESAGYPVAFVFLGAVTMSVAVMFLTYIPETGGRTISRLPPG